MLFIHWKFAKGRSAKAGEVQSADNVEELLLDSVRLAGTNSVMLVHVALPRADALGSSLGQRSAEGKEIPGLSHRRTAKAGPRTVPSGSG